MPRPLALLAFCCSLITPSLYPQVRVDPRNQHDRVIAVVPMIGAGTPADPRRPMFIPATGADSGIIGFTYELSDDGKFALVEIVAREQKALQPILQSGRPDVKAFLRGRDRKEDIEQELRRFKRDFDANRFLGVTR